MPPSILVGTRCLREIGRQLPVWGSSRLRGSRRSRPEIDSTGGVWYSAEGNHGTRRRAHRLPGNRRAGCAVAAIDLQEQEVVGGELAGSDVVKEQLIAAPQIDN